MNRLRVLKYTLVPTPTNKVWTVSQFIKAANQHKYWKAYGGSKDPLSSFVRWCNFLKSPIPSVPEYPGDIDYYMDGVLLYPHSQELTYEGCREGHNLIVDHRKATAVKIDPKDPYIVHWVPISKDIFDFWKNLARDTE